MHAIQVTLERIDVRLPQAAEGQQPRVYFHEWLGPEPIEAPLRIDARLHEARLTQNSQVFRHRRLGQFFDIAHGSLRGCKQIEDGAAARFCNDRKCRFHERYIPQ